MGKGDKKTKRGKIIMGSSGVRRKKKKMSRAPKPVEATSKPEKVKEMPVVETAAAKKAEPETKKAPAAKVDKPKTAKTTKAKKESKSSEEATADEKTE
jgi:ribosomal small subunit protein bTHX